MGSRRHEVGLRQPVQQRGRATRERILDAAAHVFADQGYGATDALGIMDVAGVGRGAFYHHFQGGKQAVAQAVVTESFIVNDLPAAADMPCLQRLVDASIVLAVAAGRLPVFKAAIRLGTEQDQPFYGHLWKVYVPLTTGWLTESVELGELQADVDPELAATSWVDAWNGRDMRHRDDYTKLPTAIAQLNAQMAHRVATPGTLSKLDLSVERGLTIFHSEWGGGDSQHRRSGRGG
jgi:AcrR family transcriptional regulator